MIEDPTISIDRQTRRYALFDGVDLLRQFRGYRSEQEAIAEGRAWFKEQGASPPRLVFPVIRRATFRTSPSRKVKDTLRSAYGAHWHGPH
jgi:hypothetical protein